MKTRSEWFLSPWHDNSSSITPIEYECHSRPMYYLASGSIGKSAWVSVFVGVFVVGGVHVKVFSVREIFSAFF